MIRTTFASQAVVGGDAQTASGDPSERAKITRRRLPRSAWIALLFVVLMPSGYYAWQHRDMPDFGRNHDDAIYFLSAKSLAEGNGYRIPSLPENPLQTKYPPLYPALLSVVWKLATFPQNLPIAAALSYAVLIACLVTAWVLYRREGFTHKRALLLVGMLALDPYLVLFGCNLFSEVFFTALLMAAFLAARRPGVQWAAIAGLIAGCAYLSRTAGIVLIVSTPLWFLWRREKQRAIAFGAAMLPFILGWMLWTRAHRYPSPPADLAYYVDYLGFQFLNVGWDNLGAVVWKNLDYTLFAMGSPVLPAFLSAPPIWILTQLMGVASICGIVRMMRQGVLVDYGLFAAATIPMLAVWHYPVTERFLLPLFPLLVAGFLNEAESLAKALRKGFRHKDRSQRVAARMICVVGCAIVAMGAAVNLYMSVWYLPTMARSYRSELRDFRAVYSWIEAHVPAGARILATDDPLLFAYTGHTAKCLPILPRWWFADDGARPVQAYRDVAAYCRSRGLEYVYFTIDNRMSWAGPERLAEIDKAVRTNPQLAPLFSSGTVTLFQVVN